MKILFVVLAFSFFESNLNTAKSQELYDDIDDIRVYQYLQPDNLNPITSNIFESDNVNQYIFETLLNLDKTTQNLNALIAKSLPKISDDHLIYKFELENNVTFSDGVPLTGKDVIFTIKMIKNLFVNSEAIRNNYENIKSVELIDGNSLEVKFIMKAPRSQDLYTLGLLKIIPKHIFDSDNISDEISWENLETDEINLKNDVIIKIKRLAKLMNSNEASQSLKHIIGSGPYILDNWQIGATITLNRNDNYWKNIEKPTILKNIIFSTVPKSSSIVTEIKNNNLDFAEITQPYDFEKNLISPEDYKMKKIYVDLPLYSYIGWNNDNILFSDKKIRWAMGYAINRTLIINEQFFDEATKVQSCVFFKSKFYNNSLNIIDYNLDKAKKILKEQGWEDTDGDGIIEKKINGKKVNFVFSFLCNNNPKRIDVLKKIIESLDVLGIKSSIKILEWNKFIENLSNHTFEAFAGAVIVNDIQPDPYISWHSSQIATGNNYISYRNTESDELLEKNRIEFEEHKRKIILDRWQQIVYEDQPITFLWSEKGKYIYNEKFTNVNFYNFLPPVDFKEWRINN